MSGWRDRSGLFIKMLASGLGTILGVSLLWLWASNHYLDVSRKASHLNEVATSIAINLRGARIQNQNVLLRDLGEESFYLEGNSEYLREFSKRVEALRRYVAEAREFGGEYAKLVEEISTGIDDFIKNFNMLIAKYRELGYGTWGLRGDWLSASGKLEELVESSGSAPLLAEFNEVLKNERRYLFIPDRYFGEFATILRRVEDKSGGLPRTLAGKIRETANLYLVLAGKHWSIRKEIGLDSGHGLLGKYLDSARAVDPLVMKLQNDTYAESSRAQENLSRANLAIMGLGVLVGGLVFFLLSRVISRPLILATRVAERIAAGDLRADLGAFHERDVLGMALKTMVRNLTDQVREIQEGANVLGSSTAEISAAVTQVTANATETATAVTQTMTTAEELRQTSELSSQKAGAVSRTASESSAKSEEGQEALVEIVRSMDGIRSQMEAIGASVVALSEQGQVIAEIIGTVDDLAEQSNILSVNASIEAAKAGEQGRGFAVVAQEIKSLAEKSKEGTARVRAILADIQKATSAAVMVTEQGAKAVENGVAQADEAARAIRSLADSIGNVDQAALQILASSRQQFSGVEQVTAAIENIREATDQNVKSMEQLEVTAESLAGIGRNIMNLMAWYKV